MHADNSEESTYNQFSSEISDFLKIETNFIFQLNLSLLLNGLTSEEEEFLNLVKEQRLYSDALKILTSISHSNKPNLKIYSKLLITYGDYLLSKKYYEDAALMFETGQDTLSAISAWEKSGNWSYCLALASQEKLSASNFENICRRLVERLKGKIKQIYKN